MKRGFSTAMIATALAAALALAASPAAAQTRERWTRASHPEQVLEGSAQARRVWHAAVPPGLRRQAWLYGLHGTAGEVGAVMIGNRRYLTGTVCKPHDCGMHNAAWLIALDNSRAAGALDLNPSRRGPRRELFFGHPNAAEREQLRASLYGGR